MIMLNRTFRKNGFMLSETKNKFILSGKNPWEVLYFSGMILCALRENIFGEK